MIRICAEILKKCRDLLTSREFFYRYRMNEKCFTRNRKLGFLDYMHFIISGAKNSLQAALNQYLDMTDRMNQSYSKQAFSKGRQRIKPEAFKELSDTVVREVYRLAETRKWHGYHLLAIDGSRMNLPSNPELCQEFGVQITGGAPQTQALCSCVFDVLNGIIVDARFDKIRASEHQHARSIIRATSWLPRPLYLFDRGYPAYELIALMEKLGQTYLMRCDKTFLKAVKWEGTDAVVTHTFSRADSSVRFRIVTVTLSTGEKEYLITNLFDESLKTEDFAELYHYRWGIETEYNSLKGKLQIENFTGNTPIAVRQDFYATLYLANLAGVMAMDYRDEIEAQHNTPENRYTYKMNVNLTIASLKQNVIWMLLCEDPMERSLILDAIANRLKSAVVPVRPGRHFERKKRHAQSKFPQNRKLP